MNTLVVVIFAACLSPNTTDYDWECVDFMNNCAINKSGKAEEKKVEQCLERWKDGEKYGESEQ